MPAANYRRARRSDAPAIVRFQLAMARESEGLRLRPEACRLGVRAVLNRPALGRYFVCERDRRVAGCLLLQREWSDWRNGSVWWIHSVYVEPACRGQGLYKGLYDHVRKLIRADRKALGLRLYVDKGNRTARKVYEKLGMDGEHYQLYEWMIPSRTR